MDETLIHTCFSDEGGGVHTVLHRPGLNKFLDDMSHAFDMVLFTAGTKAYAEAVMANVDPQRRIRTRLYRNDCDELPSGQLCKDLSRIPNVDLTRTIAVDDIPENYAWHPLNAYAIKPFVNDPYDHVLPEITPMLLAFADNDCIQACEFIELLQR